MTTNQISNSYSTWFLSSSVGSGLWTNTKKIVVSTLAPKVGLIGLGYAVGITMMDIIEDIFQKSLASIKHNSHRYLSEYLSESEIDKPSEQEKFLRNKINAILFTVILIPWAIASGMSGIANPLFSFLALVIGFAIAIVIREDYNRTSDQKINAFIEILKAREILNHGLLDLSEYCFYLRYFNLEKLGKKLSEAFKFETLVLRGCRLTNNDLKRLKEAGWFDRFRFKSISISQNPQLTFEGLKFALNEARSLKRLDLSDEDLIQLADLGCFKNKQGLSIPSNPRITVKGLTYVAKYGFQKLKCLDISENSQLLGDKIGEWIENAEFENLEALIINSSDITIEDLNQIVKAKWFYNLKTLSLNFSEKLNLKEFPKEITDLVKNKELELSILSYNFRPISPGLIELVKAREIRIVRRNGHQVYV